MKRYLTVLRWQTRFALARYGQRINARITQLAVSATWDEDTSFARFVDRVSPFVAYTGYKRIRLRKLLYRLRYPGHFLRLTSLIWSEKIVYRLVERPSLGRYEGSYSFPDTAFKTQWLDEHSEYAGDTIGDSDTYLWLALFHLIDVPWSLEPETWAIAVDSHGFVTSYEGLDAIKAYDDVARWESDQPNEEDEPEGWREGQPEFNGAFG